MPTGIARFARDCGGVSGAARARGEGAAHVDDEQAGLQEERPAEDLDEPEEEVALLGPAGERVQALCARVSMRARARERGARTG